MLKGTEKGLDTDPALRGRGGRRCGGGGLTASVIQSFAHMAIRGKAREFIEEHPDLVTTERWPCGTCVRVKNAASDVRPGSVAWGRL